MIRRPVRVALSTLACVAALGAASMIADDGNDLNVSRVLLLSIDGLHAVDLDLFVASHPDSALAALSATGRTYTNATATKPSDSFPGLLAMVTGGTPRSTGVYYDDAYNRSLAPSTATPGIACVGGTEVMWKQNLDVTPFSFTTTIDPTKLPLDPAFACVSPDARVWPHQYSRVNNIFEIIKSNGGRTAWSDKHPAYEFLMGRSGTGVDDLYTPEIVLASGLTTTNSFKLTMDYDDMKVAAIRNQIHGLDHNGNNVGVPTMFGMNFQAVSVGQKLKVEQLSTAPVCLDTNLPCVGGYKDAAATPQNGLLRTLEHTDASIGAIVQDLSETGLLDSTLIIVSAKHGNSPIDPATLQKVPVSAITTILNTVPPGAAQVSADTGPIIWMKDRSTTGAAVAALTNSIAAGNPAHIAGILSGDDLAALYGPADDRTPDIILQPIPGTVYTTSGTKIADHGGFDDDDVHVALLVSNPSISAKSIDDPVETRQIACTILKALGLDCSALESQLLEPSKFLPNSNHRKASDSGVNSVGRPSATPVRRRSNR